MKLLSSISRKVLDWRDTLFVLGIVMFGVWFSVGLFIPTIEPHVGQITMQKVIHAWLPLATMGIFSAGIAVMACLAHPHQAWTRKLKRKIDEWNMRDARSWFRRDS